LSSCLLLRLCPSATSRAFQKGGAAFHPRDRRGAGFETTSTSPRAERIMSHAGARKMRTCRRSGPRGRAAAGSRPPARQRPMLVGRFAGVGAVGSAEPHGARNERGRVMRAHRVKRRLVGPTRSTSLRAASRSGVRRRPVVFSTRTGSACGRIAKSHGVTHDASGGHALDSQCSYRINSRGAARRKVTGAERHKKEQRGDAGEDRRIGGAHVE
jgi:hypothetical protein